MRKKEGYNDKEQLKQELELLRALCDGVDEPIYVSDPDTHEILFANERIKELFGEKIIGKKCYKVFQNLNHPCPFCTNKQIFGENLGKTHIWESQNRKNKRWYRCIDKAIEWPSGKHVRFEMAIDITEYKKTEKALKESEKKYRELADLLPQTVFEFDERGNFTFANRKGFESFGYTLEDFKKGLNVLQMFIPKDRERAKKNIQRKLSGEKFGGSEYTALRKDGSTFPVIIYSSPIIRENKPAGLRGFVIDITEQKQMEEALRESEEKYRNLFENAADTIITLDRKRNVTSANKIVEKYGYERDELIGKKLLNFIPKKYWPTLSKHTIDVLRGKTAQGEVEITTKKGNLFAEYTVNPIEKNGKIVGAQVILRDVTERKKMEKTRKHFEERLSALNRHGQSLNMAEDIEKILTLTLDAMEKTLGFKFADIFLVEGKMLRLVAHRGRSKVLALNLPLYGRKGVVVKAARLGKPVFVPDVRKTKAYVEAGAKGMLSELAVPIKVGDKVLGILNVESERLAAFDEKDKELFETLASHTAIAISNLKRQEKLSALNIYGRSLNKAESMEEIYKLTIKAMEKTLGFQYASILMVERKMLRLLSHRGYSKQFSVNLPLDGEKGVTVKVAKTGKPVFVPDVRKEKAYVLGRSDMLSELAVPVKLGNKVLGVLNVESERLAAFDEDDKELFEILASHTAIAISNLRRRDRLRKLSMRLEYLMKNATEIMHAKNMRQRLNVIAKALIKFGWRRVVISLRDENLEGTDLVTAGLTKEETKLLLKRKAPGRIWRERLGPKFERFKIGEFYYLPWSDTWIREYVHRVPPGTSLEEATTYAGVPSRLSPANMVDWHPQDMLYAPLHTPEGRIVGILSMDDPLDGRKPTRESLAPLELFLHQAAMVIENAQLVESLREARNQLETYASQLEQKVEERTSELKKSQEQLLKAQRLAVIGEMAGMVGHDLRNPLTSIAGAAYYLKKRLSPKIDGKIKEMLELTEKNIVYSNKIINDLLDYSREIKLDLTAINPKSIIREALSLVEIPKNVQVIDLTENKPKIKVDVEKLKRAFVNIIKNAVEAMPKGGTLTIESRKSDGNLEFVFSDTGVGMSKKTMENLWIPLFTTKAKGMGFGLAVCKRIIEAHRGSISVKSASRKGATFTLTIPTKPKIEEGGEKIWVKPLESSLLTTTKT